MTHPMPPDPVAQHPATAITRTTRRTVVLAAVGVSAALVTGVAVRRGTMPAASPMKLVTELKRLKGKTLSSSTAWSPFQVFTHLAQSVEYSINGYPHLNSALFQHTAGAAAAFMFSTVGAMRHNLTEPIPGAPALAHVGPLGDAIDRLIAALESFDRHPGPLLPHFAYGTLDKPAYASAHVLHVRNHLQEIHG